MGYLPSPCTDCPTQTDHNKTIPAMEYEKISNAKFSPLRIDHKPTICPWERKEKFGQEATYVRVAYPLCANADFASP